MIKEVVWESNEEGNNEWVEIKPGDVISSRTRIRLNLGENSEREAKWPLINLVEISSGKFFFSTFTFPHFIHTHTFFTGELFTFSQLVVKSSIRDMEVAAPKISDEFVLTVDEDSSEAIDIADIVKLEEGSSDAGVDAINDELRPGE